MPMFVSCLPVAVKEIKYCRMKRLSLSNQPWIWAEAAEQEDYYKSSRKLHSIDL